MKFTKMSKKDKSEERLSMEEELYEIMLEGIELEWKEHIQHIVSGGEGTINCGRCARLRRVIPILKVLYPEMAKELLEYKI